MLNTSRANYFGVGVRVGVGGGRGMELGEEGYWESFRG